MPSESERLDPAFALAQHTFHLAKEGTGLCLKYLSKPVQQRSSPQFGADNMFGDQCNSSLDIELLFSRSFIWSLQTLKFKL